MTEKSKNIYVYTVMGIAIVTSLILKFMTIGWITIILTFVMVLPAYFGLYCASAVLTGISKKKHLILHTINSIIFGLTFLFWEDAADKGSNALIKNVDPTFTRYYILISVISSVVLSIAICICGIIDIVKESKKQEKEKEIQSSVETNNSMNNNLNNNIENNTNIINNNNI